MKNIRNTNVISQSPYAVQNYSGSGVDNDIVLFDGNSGKLIKDSTVPLYAPNSSVGIGGGLSSVITAENNTVCGVLSMQNTVTGNNNCAYGWASLMNCNGDGNTAVGFEAGLNYTNESYNILLGNYGTVGDTGVIRIGNGDQNKLYIPHIIKYENTNTFLGNDPSSITSGTRSSCVGYLSCNSINDGNLHCALGYGSLISIQGGSECIGIGAFAGLNYNTNESYNICIQNAGVTGESNVIRIGQSNIHSKCFLAGIYGITPVRATQSVIIDSNGQLGSVATSSSPSFESTTSIIAINSPATFGNITVYFSRINKSVNCVIDAKTHDFTGSPQNQISTLGGVIPASYRPVENVLFPMIFKSNGVYDTGLVGNVIVSSAGAFLFSRDNDTASSDFDGVSGWGWAISLSWITA